MKKLLLFYALSFLGIITLNAQTDGNGYTQMNATMGPGYANQVFVDLSENKLTSQDATIWDIAFYRKSATSFGTRINDAQAIETYQVSTDPAQWENINISDMSTWGEPLYNPDITEAIQEGAFEQADLTCNILSTGWGCYNTVNHHIEGKTIYVLKYPDDTYYKFMITDYFGAYTFKYAKWNGTAWEPTVTKTIANGTADSYFNYYSLVTNQVVNNVEPPTQQWDFMLSRYWNYYNGVMMYRLSGVIQSPRISVAKSTETQDTTTVNLPAPSEFRKGITTIGHSWKTISGLVPDMVYYIKEDSRYYRLYFTENGGSSTGNMYFKYKDITSLLASGEINSHTSFGMYPNPAPARRITLLYDNVKDLTADGTVYITDMSGKNVFSTEISKQSGFFKKELNLSHLSAGMYIVTLKTERQIISKKLILK